ncbi:hypothetical protein RRG08_036429 [Elysia crispata]|uniref:Uncharacterized protein n=1 Tax=Elysia crispata TaxID=231223 RepID=A0AAE0ZJX0_9GAST|nr:hypothetical protein RRG08_036429 [Elysia crispata]
MTLDTIIIISPLRLHYFSPLLYLRPTPPTGVIKATLGLRCCHKPTELLGPGHRRWFRCGDARWAFRLSQQSKGRHRSVEGDRDML